MASLKMRSRGAKEVRESIRKMKAWRKIERIRNIVNSVSAMDNAIARNAMNLAAFLISIILLSSMQVGAQQSQQAYKSNRHLQTHENLGCKWNAIPDVLTDIDKHGRFHHNGLFAYASDMNNILILKKTNNRVHTRCDINVQALSPLPFFHTVNDRGSDGGSSSGSYIKNRHCEYQMGAGGPYRGCEIADLDLPPGSVNSHVTIQFQPPAQIYSWAPKTECIPLNLDVKCHSIDVEASSGMENLAIGFRDYDNDGTADIITSNTPHPFWNSFRGNTPLGNYKGDDNDQLLKENENFNPFIQARTDTKGNQQTYLSRYPTLRDYCVMPLSALPPTDSEANDAAGATYQSSVADPNQNINSYDSNTGADSTAASDVQHKVLGLNGANGVYAHARSILRKVDGDIMRNGMNVLNLDGSQATQNLQEEQLVSDVQGLEGGKRRKRLEGYYFWSIDQLLRTDYFRKKKGRDKEGALNLNWVSIHYINWELASGVTMLNIKVESLVPGIEYRLAMLRGRDMEWSENHVDGVGSSPIATGAVIERFVSSFPGNQDSDYDSYATIHILVRVDSKDFSRLPKDAGTRVANLQQANFDSSSDAASPSALCGRGCTESTTQFHDCLALAMQEFMSRPDHNVALDTDSAKTGNPQMASFPLYFEFSALRTHQSSKMLNQHWHGAGGQWMGAFSTAYGPKMLGGRDSRNKLALDDVALDDQENHVFLGDPPITCTDAHNWPSDYAAIKEGASARAIRIDDVFEVSHTLHYIKLLILEPSLIRFSIKPSAGATGLVAADLVKLAGNDENANISDLDVSFPPVEAVILPFGNRQRMLAAEMRQPGMYLVRVKTPFLPVGGFFSCKSIKLRLQAAPMNMLNWDDEKECPAGMPEGSNLLAEQMNRPVFNTFDPKPMDSQMTLSHKAGMSSKSFLLGGHFSGKNKPIQETPEPGTLLRVAIESDFLTAGLVVAIWTKPGVEAHIGIPIADPIDQDTGSLELLECPTCMIQIIYVPVQNLPNDKFTCTRFGLDVANVRLESSKCSVMAPVLPERVEIMRGGAPGYLDGDFFLGGAGQDPIETTIDIGSNLVIAYGRAEGHLLTFERLNHEIGGVNSGEQLFGFWSQSGGSTLRIRVRPEMVRIQPSCVNVNLHIFVGEFQMMQACPWRDAQINNKIETRTPDSELQKFQHGVSQIMSLIEPLSLGHTIDMSHLQKIDGEQLDGSTEQKQILRHTERALFSTAMLTGTENILKQEFVVKSSAIKLRIEMTIDPPLLPLEIIIEDHTGLEFGRATRIKGRRLLFVHEDLPGPGIYFMVVKAPNFPREILNVPRDGMDVVSTGAYCADVALTIVAENLRGSDLWRQELITFPELYPLQRLDSQRLHLTSHKEIVLTQPLRVKDTGSDLFIIKSSRKTLRLIGEPLNLKFPKLSVQLLGNNNGADGERKLVVPNALLELPYGNVKLRFSYECQRDSSSDTCGVEPFMLTLAFGEGPEDAYSDTDPTCHMPKGWTGSLQPYIQNLWEPQLAATFEGARQVCAFGDNECYFGDSITTLIDSLQCLTWQGFQDSSGNLPQERILKDFIFHIPGPSMLKLTWYAYDLLRHGIKLGIETLEGVWTAEQRLTSSVLRIELPGPAKYRMRISMSELPNSDLGGISAVFGTSRSGPKSAVTIDSMGNADSPLGRLRFMIIPLGNENQAQGMVSMSNDEVKKDHLSGAMSAGVVKSVEDIDVYSAHELRPRSQCIFRSATLLPLDFTSVDGGSKVFHGPLVPSMFPEGVLFQSEVLLSDTHDGRKKFFMQLPDLNEAQAGGNSNYQYRIKLGGNFETTTDNEVNSVLGFKIVTTTGNEITPLKSSSEYRVYDNLRPGQKLWVIFNRNHRMRSLSSCERFHFFMAINVAPNTNVPGWDHCSAKIQKLMSSGNPTLRDVFSVFPQSGIFANDHDPTSENNLKVARNTNAVLARLEGNIMMGGDHQALPKVRFGDIEDVAFYMKGENSLRRTEITFDDESLREMAQHTDNGNTRVYLSIAAEFEYARGNVALGIGDESKVRWGVNTAGFRDATYGFDMATLLIIEPFDLVNGVASSSGTGSKKLYLWWEPNYPDECVSIRFSKRILKEESLSSPNIGTASVVFPIFERVLSATYQKEYSAILMGKPDLDESRTQPLPFVIENPIGNVHIVTWRTEKPNEDFQVTLNGEEFYFAQRMNKDGQIIVTKDLEPTDSSTPDSDLPVARINDDPWYKKQSTSLGDSTGSDEIDSRNAGTLNKKNTTTGAGATVLGLPLFHVLFILAMIVILGGTYVIYNKRKRQQEMMERNLRDGFQKTVSKRSGGGLLRDGNLMNQVVELFRMDESFNDPDLLPLNSNLNSSEGGQLYNHAHDRSNNYGGRNNSTSYGGSTSNYGSPRHYGSGTSSNFSGSPGDYSSPNTNYSAANLLIAGTGSRAPVDTGSLNTVNGFYQCSNHSSKSSTLGVNSKAAELVTKLATDPLSGTVNPFASNERNQNGSDHVLRTRSPPRNPGLVPPPGTGNQPAGTGNQPTGMKSNPIDDFDFEL